MSTRFWLASGAVIGASAMIGLGIGSYATNLPSYGVSSYTGDIQDDVSEAVTISDDGIDTGPGEIICKGCGPTLAERRMQQENPGWDPDGMTDGTRDPVVAAYLAQDEPTMPREASTPPAHRLPENIQRFSNGEQGAAFVPPPPVTLSRGSPPT